LRKAGSGNYRGDYRTQQGITCRHITFIHHKGKQQIQKENTDNIYNKYVLGLAATN